MENLPAPTDIEAYRLYSAFETRYIFVGDNVRLNGRITNKQIAVHNLTFNVMWYRNGANPIVSLSFIGGVVLKSGRISTVRTDDFVELSEVPQPLRSALINDFNISSPIDAPVLDPATGEVI